MDRQEQVSEPKIASGQVWQGSNGYGEVKITRINKKYVFFYPRRGGGAEFRKDREEFLQQFNLVG